MSIFEYDEEREIQLIRGMKRGIEQGLLSVARNMLLKQEPIDKIQEYSGLSKEVILQLREEATYKA